MYVHTVAMGEVGTADGSAAVRLGRTSCVAGIKAELSNPPIDNPGHGWLVPNVSITSVSSPDVAPGPPPPQAQTLSQHLAEVLAVSLRDIASIFHRISVMCWYYARRVECVQRCFLSL